MASYELVLRGRSPAEVETRFAAQIAPSHVPETMDPVRYHGVEVRPGAFELRHYELVNTRFGLRRLPMKFRAEVTAHADGARFVMHLDEQVGLVAGAVCGFLPVLIAVPVLGAKLSSADAAHRASVLAAIPVVAVVLLGIGSATVALVHWLNVRALRRERLFVERWLAARG